MKLGILQLLLKLKFERFLLIWSLMLSTQESLSWVILSIRRKQNFDENNYIDHFYKTWDFFLWILLVRQQLIHRKDMVENILHKLFQFEFSFQLGKINTCKNHLFEEDRANPANASFNKTLILQGNAKVISECEKYLNLMV